jgi:hypothetical protein
LHVCPGILLGNNVDTSWKVYVATYVIGMSVRIDNPHYWLIGELFDFSENSMAPTWKFGVDHSNAVAHDEDAGIAPTSFEHIEIVSDFGYLQRFGLILLTDGRRRNHARQDHHT